MFGAGCTGCNFQHDFGNVLVNGTLLRKYMEDKENATNYIEIEPVTGTMTKQRRSYTMVATLNCYSHSTIGECNDHG